MSITIYKYGTIVARATIDPLPTSQQSVTLMAEDTLTLNYTVTEPIQFQYGDYCYFMDKLYQVNSKPTRNLKSTRDLEYTLVLEAEMYDLGKAAFLFLNSNNVFTDAVFTFRGTPKDYGDLLIYNLNRVFPTAGWILGNVIEADFITQDFKAQNCLEALKTIASIFNTEYLIEGKVINIFQRQSVSGAVFKYGEALLNITEQPQTNANVITRLYAFGSTKNIVNAPPTFTYRNGAQNLRMGDKNYLEKNVDLFGVWESTIIFDGTTSDVKTNAPLPEIYPHRTGKITAVDDFLSFYDNTIDFSVNDNLIPGVTAQIEFNTGLLSGYKFNIQTFNDTTKKFTINQDTSNPNLIVPTATLSPKVGDTYVILNINMPQQYITDAEAQVKAAAQAYFDENCIPPMKYSFACNSIWFKRNNPPFALAQSVNIQCPTLLLNINIRIVSFTRNVRNPYLFTMKLADTVPTNSIIVKLINAI